MVWRIREGKIGTSSASRMAHYLSDAATPDHDIRLAQYLTQGHQLSPQGAQPVKPGLPNAVSIVPPMVRKTVDPDIARKRREEILDIKKGLAARADKFALQLLGSPENRLTDRQYKYDGGKMLVTVSGPKAGLWHNFAGNEYGKKGGNLLDLAEWKFGSTANAVQWARDQLGFPTPDWSKPQTREEAKAIAARVDALEKEAVEKRVRAEADIARRQEAVAAESLRRWEAASPADEHPYLTRKGVSGEGLRIEGKNLLLPLFDFDGKLWAVQAITPEGGKLFPADGRMAGTFFAIGDVHGTRSVAFAEGYATGRALHDATGVPVVVTWNVYNKENIVREWTARHPAQTLIDAADNDWRKALEPGKRNAGLDMAEKLRRELGVLPALPTFSDDQPGSDWQDFISLNGRDAAKRAFAKAVSDSRRQATGVATPHRGMDHGIAHILKVDPNRPLNVEGFAHILAGRAADGTELPSNTTGRPRETAYMEFMASAPKSISVAYALAKTPEERAAIVLAHRNSVDAAFEAVTHDLAMSHNGKRGVVAAFDVEHINSRPTVEIANGKETELRDVPGVKGDPNLHTHRIVPNIMLTEDGRTYALNGNAMANRMIEFDAIYQASLAAELGRVGIKTRLENNAVEITAVPKFVRDHFSKRDQNARVAAREWAQANGFGDWDALPDATKLRLIDGAVKEGKNDKRGDYGDFDDWRRQAAEIGYDHRSVMRAGSSWEPVEDRHRIAYERSLPLLEKELQGQAVIHSAMVRAVAARGLIAAGGLARWQDVNVVTRMYWDEGVRQDGRHTKLVWGRDEDGAVWVFTRLSEDQERRFVRLAREGHQDRATSLPEGAATRRATTLGLDLSGAHGAAQARAMEGLAAGGAVAVAFGAAGAGKTTMLRPVVEEYLDRGWNAFGISLANRQANELTDASIPKANTMAVQPFMARLREGKLDLSRTSLVVVDEVALLGTHQGLELLEAQRRIGFKLVAVGGPEQSQSIEAGSTTDLFVRGIGKDNIPNIETTIRQRDPEEARIADLFRRGAVEDALRAKLARHDAEFVPGGREELIARVASEYARIRQAEPMSSVAIGTTSHKDAHEIGVRVREAIGLKDVVRISARQGDDAVRDMGIAHGDRVRLYGRTWGATPDGRKVHVGDNGNIVEVVKANKEGVQFRTKTGELAGVKWDKLSDREGKIRLSYGYAQTTIIVQGATEDHYLAAFVGGSATVSGNAAYVHGSRHRRTSRMFFSDGAERRDIISKRRVGEDGPISAEDILKNAAKNLGKPGDKETVHRFLERVKDIQRSVSRDLTRQVAHEAQIAQTELRPSMQEVKEGVIRLRDRRLSERAITRGHEQARHRVAHDRGIALKR